VARAADGAAGVRWVPVGGGTAGKQPCALAATAAGWRTLAFSLGTRNAFVVLPFALALPAGWETTVVVIVFQSLVELFGMVFYLWWLPRHLFILPGDEAAISRRIPKQ
jgi:hypothetical protein